MYKLLKIGVFSPQNRNDWFLDFSHNGWKMNIVMLCTVWLQFFLLIKNTGRSSSQSWKSEDLQGGKLQLPGCLSTNIAKHISNPLKLAFNNIAIIFIANLRGLEMCLAFGVLGLFVICLKRFWVLLKGNRCILQVLFYMCISYSTVF